MNPNNNSPNVVLYVREDVSSDTRDRQMAVHERLRELQTEGRIEELSAEIWAKQMYVDAEHGPIAADERSDHPLSTYNQFSEWAQQAGYSLEPGFSTQTVSSLLTDKREKVIKFPVMCLAAYDDSDLIDVAPRSSEEGEVHTVENFLEELRRVDRSPAADNLIQESRRRYMKGVAPQNVDLSPSKFNELSAPDRHES